MKKKNKKFNKKRIRRLVSLAIVLIILIVAAFRIVACDGGGRQEVLAEWSEILGIEAEEATETVSTIDAASISTEIPFELNDNMQRASFIKKVDGDTAWFAVSGEIAGKEHDDPGYSVESTEFKVRFLAVDTPETVKQGVEVQEWGPEASEYTTERLQSASTIYLEWDDASSLTDRYDRYLAWVWCDGSLLQAELVAQGLAEVTYIYGDYKYLDELYAIEAAAQEAKVGIWSE